MSGQTDRAPRALDPREQCSTCSVFVDPIRPRRARMHVNLHASSEAPSSWGHYWGRTRSDSRQMAIHSERGQQMSGQTDRAPIRPRRARMHVNLHASSEAPFCGRLSLCAALAAGHLAAALILGPLLGPDAIRLPPNGDTLREGAADVGAGRECTSTCTHHRRRLSAGDCLFVQLWQPVTLCKRTWRTIVGAGRDPTPAKWRYTPRGGSRCRGRPIVRHVRLHKVTGMAPR
jgi:hypothetical protein